MLLNLEKSYESLLEKLNRMMNLDEPVLKRTERAVELVEEALQELKQFSRQQTYADVQDEIEYYKNSFPFFYSLYIYYVTLFHLERNIPTGDLKLKNKFLRKELKKLNAFFQQHQDFITYYKLGKSYQDILFFTKKYNTEQRWLTLDIYACAGDLDFCTMYSMHLATLLAYEQLQKYLSDALADESHALATAGALTPDDDMTWQAPITSLAELIIALYISKVFKGPKLTLAKVSRYICRMFGIEPINIHKSKEELRLRKKSRSPFFDTSRMNLLRYWDEEDLHAL